MLSLHEEIALSRNGLSRRSFLHTVGAASIASGVLGFRDALSLQADELRKQGKAMILLWMNGAPSQFDCFDPKTGDASGGTKSIATATPGIRIAERWPNVAKVTDDLAIIRSMTNKEGNHLRAQYQLHTGYLPSGSVKHPAFASAVTEQLADPGLELPGFVSIGRTQGAGFLGVRYEPFAVLEPGQMPNNLGAGVPESRLNRRLGLVSQLDNQFAERGASAQVAEHQKLYKKTADMVLSQDVEAFDLAKESASLRESYGDSKFGRGCLLARRLVERGVTCVEVRSDGWDTHFDAEERLTNLTGSVDPAFAALITDLKSRGMLENTLVVWAGEFGRTPRINARGGRDHFPVAFSSVMAGCGVKGGQVIGSTTKDGTRIDDRPVAVPDFHRTIAHALGVDADVEHISPLGRPMKVVDGGEVVEEVFS